MANPDPRDEDSEALRSNDIFQLMNNIKAFEKLRLKNFDSVQTYTKTFCDLDRKISSASRQVLPEPLLVAKYLNGLGPAYKEFLYRFTLSHKCFFDEHHAPHVTLEDAVWDALAAEHAMSGLRNPLAEFAEHILEKEALVSSIMGERFKKAQSNHCEYCKREGHVEAKCFKKYPYLKASSSSHQQRPVKTLEEMTPTPKKPSTTFIERTLANANAEAVLGTSKALQIPPTLTVPAIFKDEKIDPDVLTEWIIDSTASHHLCWDKSQFNTIEPYWKVGAIEGPAPDISGYCPEGYGTVNLICTVNHKPKLVLLTDVLLCPELPANFLSLNQLKSHGVTSSIPCPDAQKSKKDPKAQKPSQKPTKAQINQKSKEDPKMLMIFREEVVLTGSKKKEMYTVNLWKESSPSVSRVIKL